MTKFVTSELRDDCGPVFGHPDTCECTSCDMSRLFSRMTYYSPEEQPTPAPLVSDEPSLPSGIPESGCTEGCMCDSCMIDVSPYSKEQSPHTDAAIPASEEYQTLMAGCLE